MDAGKPLTMLTWCVLRAGLALGLWLFAGCGSREERAAEPTDVFIYDDVDATTGASPRAQAAIRTILRELEADHLATVTVDYPLQDSRSSTATCR
jgi:hypothetical protein